ncbi:MAG: tetratricopeptide repeat protein [Kiritimatiellia bacterium]
MSRSLPVVLAAAAALLLAPSAKAFSLFGKNPKSEALSAIRKADKIMARADSAYDGGNPDQALALYRKATDIFERVEGDFPGIDDGTARLHLAYCQDQIRLIEGKTLPHVPSAPSLDLDAPPPFAWPEDEGAAAGGGLAAVLDDGAQETFVDSGSIPGQEDGRPPPAAFDPAPLFHEAHSLFEAGRLDAAAAAMVEVLRADPQNRSARLMMGVIRCRQYRYDEALVALEDLLAEEKDEAVLLALAAVYQSTGRFDYALLALDKAIRLNPKLPAAYFDMAALMLSRGEEASAEAHYREAVRLGGARDLQLERLLGF